MKKSNFILTVLIFVVFITNGINSQNLINQEKEQDGYLIYFESDVSQNTIDSIMNRYNSYEEWITKYSKVRYWKVKSYPFAIDDSVAIGNIQELYDAWVNEVEDPFNDDTESGLGSLSYNYKIKKEINDLILGSSQEYDLKQCSQYFDAIKKGTNKVLVDILDTGFDFNNDNSNFSSVDILGGYNFISNSSYAQDDNGHGTHITSIISSLTTLGNSSSISIFESKTHNNEGLGKLSDIVRAIDHSIEIGANIINASWSFYGKESDIKTPVQIAIETAGNYGVLFIAAMGNDAIDNESNILKAYPASYASDNILSVASNACDTTLSYFSNYGYEKADICAIGENIPGFVLNGQLALLSGTSQSTAYVSAVAAILSTYMTDFDPKEVKRLILDGATFNNYLIGLVKTEGIVNLRESLDILNQNINPFAPSFLASSAINTSNESTVYPTIFMDDININLNSTENKIQNVKIIDFWGNLIASKDYKTKKGVNKLKFDGLAKVKPGIYYLKTELLIKKVIKMR